MNLLIDEDQSAMTCFCLFSMMKTRSFITINIPVWHSSPTSCISGKHLCYALIVADGVALRARWTLDCRPAGVPCTSSDLDRSRNLRWVAPCLGGDVPGRKGYYFALFRDCLGFAVDQQSSPVLSSHTKCSKFQDRSTDKNHIAASLGFP